MVCKHRSCVASRSSLAMWMKNMNPFLGLKIVPEIVAEMNEKGQSMSRLCGDAEEEKEVTRPKPQHVELAASCAPSHASAIKPYRRLKGTTSLPPEREAGHEILDILLSKANSGSLTSHYIGSPPCRAGNPVIHDAQFTKKTALPSPVNISCRKSPALFGGNASAKSPALHGSKSFVRIEGFMPSSSGELQQRIPAFA